MTPETIPVLIVGAGPVGLTLAMDLAQRGVPVLMAETRHRGEPPNVKCNHVSARTMEILRRLGVAARVRSSGLPEDYPHDVAYRTSFTELNLGYGSALAMVLLAITVLISWLLFSRRKARA